MTVLRDLPVTWKTAVVPGLPALSLVVLGALGVASADFAFQWQPVRNEIRSALWRACGRRWQRYGLDVRRRDGMLNLPAQAASASWRSIGELAELWATPEQR